MGGSSFHQKQATLTPRLIPMADNYLEKQQEAYEQKRDQWLKNTQAKFLRARKNTSSHPTTEHSGSK